VQFTELQKQELSSYQQVIQTAFREVDDSLVDQKNTKVQLEASGRQLAAPQEYARLAQLRFDNGIHRLPGGLDANRTLF